MTKWTRIAAICALRAAACSNGPLGGSFSGTSTSSTGASGGTLSAGTLTGGTPPSPGYDAQLSAPTLSFASVGDTRPSKTCSSSAACAYPSQIIARLYQQIEALSPPVPLVISTGDYQYNSPGDGTARWQMLQQYLPAAQQFRGPVYAAMGNHECNGYTDSNCTPGGPLPCTREDVCGITENLSAFLALLGSMGLPGSRPYYAVGVSLGGGLTAKFVVAAPNAWDSSQASWLATTLSRRTTYTFLVQHEPNNLDQADASFPAALAEIRSLVRQSGQAPAGLAYPLTLWIVGHTHNFDYDPANQQVINGLGGAPTNDITDGEDPSHFYRTDTGAYLLCRQQASGEPPAVQCALVDSETNGVLAGPTTTFAINADGTPAPLE